MSIHTVPPGHVRLLRASPQLAGLLLLSAVAWTAMVVQSAAMSGAADSTMMLGLPSFLVMWALMMAAMMLPAVAPVADLYGRTVRSCRTLRLSAFTLGYLTVWTVTGVPAFLLTQGAARSSQARPAVATGLAVAAYAACGLYQLTPYKERCLRHCRSPLALLLHYGSYRGRLRDLAVGIHHGAYCAGCCWALFVLLIVAGVMNLLAMVVLAAVVLVEKLGSRGVGFSRAVGVVALALAVAVIWLPELAPGLHAPTMTDPMKM